jgi:hypothetical protein
MKNGRRLFLLLCLSTSVFALPAQAQDVPPAVQAMLDSMARQTNTKPSYASLEQASDGTVKIGALTLALPAAAGNPGMNVVIGEVSLAGIADQGEGLYQIGTAKFSNVKVDLSDPDFSATVTMPEGIAEDWYIKSLGEGATAQDQVRAAMTVARKMSSGPLSISAMGQTITVDGYEQTFDGDPRSGAGTYVLKMNNLAIPEQVVALADQGGMLKQLGYGALNFDVSSTSRLSIEGANLGLDFDLALSGRDIGTMTFAGSAAGIPAEAYAELQRAGSSGQQPDFNAVMPQIQNITINGASFRFDDASVTKRLMPMMAAMQGMDEATMVNTAGAMVQMGLMQLQSPQFAEQAANAVNAYLKDPRSITIAAKPSSPVKVSDMMTLDPSKPQDTISKLGVTVSAND